MEIYNPAPVTLGSHAILSQEAYVCGATHDYDDPAFPLIAYAMNIGAVCLGMRPRVGGAWSESGRRRGARAGIGCYA